MPGEGREAAQEVEGVCGSREWDEDSCRGAARRRTFRKWCCGRVNRGIQAKGWEVCRLQQKGRDPELSWVSGCVAHRSQWVGG